MTRREDILLSEILYDAMTAPARGSTHDNGEEPPPPGPVITSSSTPSVPENTVGTMFTVTATGGDGVLVYSIEGGADAAFFTIDSATGVVSSEEEFDFESPADDDADNVFELTVGVSDGVNPAVTQDVMLTVTDLESPSITSDDAFDFAEGATGVVFTAIATGGGGGYTFSLEGSNGDYAFFSIDSETGEVSLDDPLDFEVPADSNDDNVYEMRVVVTSANGEDASQEVTVTVTDVSNPPVITSGNAFNFAESATGVVFQVTSTGGTGTVVYTTEGGADQALFTIDDSTGEVEFVAPPDFEDPQDDDANNVYELIVGAFDEENELDTMTVNVTVTDVVEVVTVIWDTATKTTTVTLSNGDLDAAMGSHGGTPASVKTNTSRASGKYYFELENIGTGANTDMGSGFVSAAASSTGGLTAAGTWLLRNQAFFAPGGAAGFGISTLWSVGGVVGFALDITGGKYWLRNLNGTWVSGGDPAAGTGNNGTFTANTEMWIRAGTHNEGSTANAYRLRAKAADFANAAPTGFSAWQS